MIPYFRRQATSQRADTRGLSGPSRERIEQQIRQPCYVSIFFSVRHLLRHLSCVSLVQCVGIILSTRQVGSWAEMFSFTWACSEPTEIHTRDVSSISRLYFWTKQMGSLAEMFSLMSDFRRSQSPIAGYWVGFALYRILVLAGHLLSK